MTTTNPRKNESLTTLTVAGANTIWLISANDLLKGHVVYMTPTAAWSSQLIDALNIADKSVAQEQLAKLVSDESIVVGHTLVEANQHPDGSLNLSHYRDRIREVGPTH